MVALGNRPVLGVDDLAVAEMFDQEEACVEIGLQDRRRGEAGCECVEEGGTGDLKISFIWRYEK